MSREDRERASEREEEREQKRGDDGERRAKEKTERDEIQTGGSVMSL